MHLARILISLLFIGYGSYYISQQVFNDFEPYPATVTESFKKLIPSNNNHRSDKYYYSFKYEYTYAEKKYSSENYTFSGGKSEAVCQLEQGQKITAYINHNNPEFAVVIPKVSSFIMAITVIGLIMLIASLLTYLMDIYQQKTHANPVLQKANMYLNLFIGFNLFFGGIGYFIYKMINAAKDCV